MPWKRNVIEAGQKKPVQGQMPSIKRQRDVFIVRVSYTAFQAFIDLLKKRQLKMVEAAGVEPASERASNREPSCFFQFIFVSSSPLRTDKDAATTSLIDLVFHRADGAGKTSLLCDDRYRPVGEA